MQPNKTALAKIRTKINAIKSNSLQSHYAFQPVIQELTDLLTNTVYPKRSQHLRQLATIQSSLRNQTMRLSNGSNATTSLQKKLIAIIQSFSKPAHKIFIVHGRDINMRTEVEAVLGKLKLDYAILEREENAGQTVIEKFIRAAKDCTYAIVLFSADDAGRLFKKGTVERRRARQNVVLELGYFLAKVGRKNIFVLHSPVDLETPSDFAGMVYETYDPNGAWKNKLIREMKAAKIPIDQKLADKC